MGDDGLCWLSYNDGRGAGVDGGDGDNSDVRHHHRR